MRDGKLYLQELDGDPEEVATEGSVSDLTWSPHGERLVFRAGEAERSRWHIVEADGSDVRTVGPSGLRRMSLIGWSPDAQRLAFQFFPLTSETPIAVYVAPIEGGDAVKMGEYPWPPGRDSGPPETPRWSLDARRILVFGDVRYAVDATGAAAPQPLDPALIDAEFGP